MSPLPRISRPANRALAEIGVVTLEDAAKYSAKQLLALHGVGPKAIRILEPALALKGLALRPEAKHS